MFIKTRIFRTPLWYIFVGANYCNCKYLFLILVPNLIAAVLEGASFTLILLAFSVLDGSSCAHSAVFSYDFFQPFLSSFSPMQIFYFFILSAIFMQAFRGFVNYFAFYGISLLSLKVQVDAQNSVYQQIFRFSYAFVSKFKTGDLSEYIKNPSTFVPLFFDTLNRILISFFMIIGLVFVLFCISPALTVLTVVLFSVFAFLQKGMINKISKHSVHLTSQLFEFSHQTVQSLQGIRPIYIFQKQKYILEKVGKTLKLIANASKSVYLWNNSVPAINEAVNVLLVGAILVLGSWVFAHNGQAVLSSLLTYIALTYRLTTRLQICMSSLSIIGSHYGSLLKLNEVLETYDKEFIPLIHDEITSWERCVEFQGISLLYPGAQKMALNQVSFSIQKGTTVAFVGLSGAGKSSVIDLMLGLQKPTEGAVLVDSKNLALFSSESWLKRIGVVSQDTFMFNGTIEENVHFGDLHASIQDIKAACDLAGALEFIEALPLKFQTVIGERGYRLSGGERQRIALARALLRNPEMLILDEATSNLDSYSERKIQNSLNQIQKDKTLVLVAHRLSTVIQADQIFVLEDGKIVENGKHEKLILQKGLYSKLWKIQSEKVRV